MKITNLTHHGLGRAEDGTLIPGTLPGETVVDGAITDPSPHRVTPPCAQAGTCGGCAVQHASDAFVLRWKAGILTRALAAHGLNAPLRRAQVSPARSRRRAKLSGRRMKSGALVGFHARASDQIVPPKGCTVLHPSITAALPALTDLIATYGSRKGTVDLTVTTGPSGLDVRVDGLNADLSDWATTHDVARVSLGDEPQITRRPPMIPMGRAQLTPPPGGFLQATSQGQTALINAVTETLTGCSRVVDLFAGSGTFALPLAEKAQVHAVESLAPPLDALNRAWRQTQGLHQITTEVRDLFRAPLDASDLARFDGAVLDPPRAGAAAQTAQLADHGPGKIAYVSCNPISFAKDAKKLIEAGYTLDHIDLIDQFRWSPHIELAAAFSRT